MANHRICRRRCPHEDCRSNREGLRTKLVLHSRLKTQRGERRRLRCKHCNRTFVSTRGTVYYRLRRPRAVVDRVTRARVDGVAPAVIARVEGVSQGTISRWRERTARHAWRFTHEHLRIDWPVELQFDELKGMGATEESDTWVYNCIEVWTRVWVSWRVARRTLRSTTVVAREARDRLRCITEPVLCTSDEMKYYPSSLKRAFEKFCVHVQVDNRYSSGRLVRTNWKLIWGPKWRLDAARSRSEDSKKPNTSYVERLHLTVRRGCSYLHRRTNGRMRKRRCLGENLALQHCHYNFVRPHASLKLGKQKRTPAMQAGIFDRPLTLREIFSWVPKPDPWLDRLPVDESRRQDPFRARSSNS